MKKVILLVLLLASMGGFQAKAQNLIPNGSFESGSGNSFTNWWTSAGNGSATFTAATANVKDGSRALQVDVTALGTNPWEIQAVNDAWASKSGQSYTLTFWAKAATAGSRFKAVLQLGSAYAEKSFTLTDTWQQYEWAFAAGADDLQLKFQFLSTGTFYIDNLIIPPAAQLKELLTNGGFENGTGDSFSNWWTQVGGGGQGAFTAETVDVQQGSRAMKVTITQAGSAAYSIQAVNDAWPSVTGTEYTLNFYAKSATAGKTVRVVQQTSTYASKDFVLTDAWQKYTWTFTAQEADLQLRLNFPAAGTFYLDNFSILGSADDNTPPPPYTPTGPPIATGQPKFLGGVYSASQLPNFTHYFNQVVAENAGKWGSVEATRDVMNWSELDAAYKLAKDNGFPFRMHVMIWGNQQPAWIENLPPAEQLEEIEEWFAAVAARYPDIAFLEVVNEPTNDPPVKQNATDQGSGNYFAALGGNGTTGWDWVISAFQLARKHFPTTTLMINDYSVENTPANTQRYLGIINLLRERSLIDAIGIQGHAFSTRPTQAATLKSNLDLLASTGLPIYVTELDIDGRTDEVQLAEYQRIFPVFWEHPAVKGITLWGYRPGHWRTEQGAYLAYTNGAERAALKWLREYVQSNTNVHVPAITSGQSLRLDAAIACNALGKVTATDADASTVLQGWQLLGGTGVSIFTLDAATGQLTIAHPELIDFSQTAYTLTVQVSDGFNTSAAGTVTILIPDKVYVLHKGKVLHIDKTSVPDHLSHGDCIGSNEGTVTMAGGSTRSNQERERVSVYPNPASEGKFKLVLPDYSAAKKAVVQLVDLEGRILLEQQVTQPVTNVEQPLKPGIYLIRVIQEKEVTVKKMIVQ
ncbi:endo-1,4-beta-xylanase [Pontibacter sp. E15-1]|uniref:endo-1,4-beta-xylanase n=1 Tax=Pontibacter sp. E15-1 TaxID=2919918 RepID=UPI001F4F2F9F|nr:endo-1,4-beta-xylanase [Pontibacter sp. E15-1]MCJ8165322.1 endo-1,4-beta-xylanase [Pontibacter sp. E15-1]